MKTKIALLMLAALGSAALVAPAQQAPPQDPFAGGGGDRQLRQVLQVAPPAVPAPPVLTFTGAPNPPQVPQSPARPAVAWYTVSADLGPRTHEAKKLAETYAHESSESARVTIRKQLTALLMEQFDDRQKRHQDEIKQLEAQIKKLKDLIDKRQENREDIISRRLDQMLKEAQGLGW
jgi:hypothetical protein